MIMRPKVLTLIKMHTIKKILSFLILFTLLCCLWMTYRPDNTVTEYSKNFNHFRKTRNLSDYLYQIKLLLEPKRMCNDTLPILVMVTSAPSHTEQRNAIRKTWATQLRTLFVLGLNNGQDVQHLNDRNEDDLIIYEFKDHYQNLTLKSALMLKWASEKCSSVKYLLKTDDDILLNPWQLKRIEQRNPDSDLIGYRMVNADLDRRQSSKWHLPSWLYPEDFVPEYLSGNAYLINGKNLKPMLEAAYDVPLINIEDIYITFLVARQKLGLKLIHEPRLYGFRPWLPLTSFYWELASVHSLTPSELLSWWPKLLAMSKNVN